ncbi:EF-P lysine aminoacylase GenX [Posidoniimonas polymericola]|nr:amino acid--tRNA ligase-related protein [Posidoniimonas polymericola]
MKPEYLRAKSELLDQLREFFHGRGFAEVVTPIESREVIPERHIELFKFDGAKGDWLAAGPMPTRGAGGEAACLSPFAEPRAEIGGEGNGDGHAGLHPARQGKNGPAASQSPFSSSVYLQASPEMAMKQLLCRGSGPIFQFAKAFRAEERGPLHSPEFTMLEWYRPGHDMAAGVDLLDELIQATLSPVPCKRTSYRDAIMEHAGCDPFDAAAVQEVAAGLIDGTVNDTDELLDEFLNVLLATRVEPHLGAELPEIVYHYPASQSALAQTAIDDHGHAVAERFELYYRGVELANGYHELTDAAVLRRRLIEANQGRTADGREPLPLPEEMLALMESPGLPPCAGVALGFDRLLMQKVGAESIDEVL